jgi:hypothetical protein
MPPELSGNQTDETDEGTMRTVTADTRVVILSCPRCQQCHDVDVQLVSMGCKEDCDQFGPHEEPDLRFTLPDNCACGESLDTPDNCGDVQDTALLMFAVQGAL